MIVRELTKEEKKGIGDLVKQCANYETPEKYCLPLETACYMMTKAYTGPLCKHFSDAVLPLDKKLEAALNSKQPIMKSCAICGNSFVPKSNRQQYCGEKCRKTSDRNHSRKRMNWLRKMGW